MSEVACRRGQAKNDGRRKVRWELGGKKRGESTKYCLFDAFYDIADEAQTVFGRGRY